MAYNPFNIFRRNQKAIFAVITVFIMFTFVLSSGLGGGADFFDWLPRWLGAKSKKGDVLCTMDGNKVYESELTETGKGLRYQRVIANRYMNLAAQSTAASVEQVIGEQMTQVSPESRKIIQDAMQAEQMAQLMASNPQFANPTFMREAQEKIEKFRALPTSPNARAADKEAARNIQYLRLIQMQTGGGRSDHYFNNTPNRTSRDLIDFMLWQKKADQLGIKFTPEDVKQLIAKEFYGFFRDDSQRMVQKELQQMQGFNINKCFEAVGEEFRVRAAQAAVLGPVAYGRRIDKTYGGFPAFSPPYEMFDYYRDQCSPTTYGAIPIPAINYLDKVGEPNESDPKVEEELDQLFKKYKDSEPNYARETPGFKKPREIKIEWLGITGTEPYYVKEAETTLKNELLMANLRTMMTAPIAANSLVTAANANPFVTDPQLAQKYDFDVVALHKAALRFRYNRADLLLSDVLDTSIVRPGNMAAAAGGLGGQLLAFGNPFAAVAGTVSGPMAYEVRDRVKAGMPLFLGAVPGPGMLSTMTASELAYRELLPKALSLDVFKPDLLKKLSVDKAKELAKKDMDAFIKEVKKLSDDGKVKEKDADKLAALRKYIDEFATKRGLTLGKTKNPHSEWTLEEDPDVAALVAAQKESLLMAGGFHQSQFIPFANSFFWVAGDRRNPVSGTYAPEFYPEQKPVANPMLPSTETKPQYIVWRTQEIASKTQSYPDAKDAVKAAWKRVKAREMAQKRAEAMTKAIQASTTPEANLSMLLADEQIKLRNEFADPKAQDRTREFLIEGVCPLTTVTNPTAKKGLFSFSPSTQFNPLSLFRIVPSENVKYPSAEMNRMVLDERTKAPKTAFVLSDEPKDVYYVVTLMKRDVKTDNEFKSQVYEDNPMMRMMGQGNPTRAAIIERFNQDTQRKAYLSVMGLLKKEFKYEETEEQKKKLDEKEKSGGGDQ